MPPSMVPTAAILSSAGPCGSGSKALFNYSATGALTSGTFGGDQTCGTTGCSDNVFSLTFQSEDLSASFSTQKCEVGPDTARHIIGCHSTQASRVQHETETGAETGSETNDWNLWEAGG